MKFVDTSVKLLGWGSVAIGVWGLIHPKSLTVLMGDDPDLGRPLALRDAVVGVALLKSGKSWALALRVANDVQDAFRLRRRSPMIALGAAAVVAWGVTALAGRMAE